jgi:hypothetical protein
VVQPEVRLVLASALADLFARRLVRSPTCSLADLFARRLVRSPTCSLADMFTRRRWPADVAEPTWTEPNQITWRSMMGVEVGALDYAGAPPSNGGPVVESGGGLDAELSSWPSSVGKNSARQAVIPCTQRRPARAANAFMRSGKPIA